MNQFCSEQQHNQRNMINAEAQKLGAPQEFDEKLFEEGAPQPTPLNQSIDLDPGSRARNLIVSAVVPTKEVPARINKEDKVTHWATIVDKAAIFCLPAPVLRSQAKLLLKRPDSGRVLLYGAGGALLARFQDADQAGQILKQAGVSMDRLKLHPAPEREAKDAKGKKAAK
jgi:hypothetical protein